MSEANDWQAIGHGRTADIMAHAADAETVVKLFKPFIPQTDVEREYAAGRWLRGQDIATPAALGLVRIDGRLGIRYTRAAGVPLLRLMLEQPLQLEPLSRRMAALHIRVHACDGAGMGIRQKEVLAAGIRRCERLDAQERQALLRLLERLPEEQALCHGDYHPDNIMAGAQDVVLDWMNGMSGSPAGDAARTWLLLKYGAPPEHASEAESRQLQAARETIREAYLAEYIRLSGRGKAEIAQWLLPVAAQRLTEGIPEPEKEAIARMIRQRLQEAPSG
ncbi:aminoglycoside phosphotransferase family protein [Paenibacillus sp. IB182496]|uniref:Aminoglycoside phosphotransferase family protein n=1 Tax=Paenibacillus sabuli TaxID=2772509 RepID=A0A927BPM7_9BACL|nr:aminoglycoside phosphotransferase family protein [Paenibacillus sabuli]MBD2843636.1 aminoglycoside phosphotransferase family protein [Paenibacillus sabuli]